MADQLLVEAESAVGVGGVIWENLSSARARAARARIAFAAA